MTQLSIPYGLRRHLEPVQGAYALVTEGLTVGYPGANKPAVRDVSIHIPAGSRVALVGANGAGKSSLLKAIMGLLPVHSGKISVLGHPVGRCCRRIAYLPQRGEIDWTFPVQVERLILTGRYVHLGWLRRPGPKDHQKVQEVAKRIGLTSLLDRQIGQLSGGQQQRALLARALVQDADLFLLDEPLNAVDSESREVIRSVLKEKQQEGKTMLIATHEHGWRDEDFDAIVLLQEGKQTCLTAEAWSGWRPGKGPVCPG